MTNMPTPIHGINNENREQLMKHKKDGLVNIIKRYQKASRFDMKPEPPLNEYDTMVVEKNKIHNDLIRKHKGTTDALGTLDKQYGILITENDNLREEIDDIENKNTKLTISLAQSGKEYKELMNTKNTAIGKLHASFNENIEYEITIEIRNDTIKELKEQIRKYMKLMKKVDKIIHNVD